MLFRFKVWVVVVAAAVLLPAGSAGAVGGFGDVDTGRFYTDPVQWSTEVGLTGIEGPCFEPSRVVTRGESAVWLWNLQGRPDAAAHGFDDVAESLGGAVSWMAAQRITTGTTPTTFSPDGPLTRAQAAAFLHRLAGEPVAPAHGFNDVQRPWQQQPVSWMAAQRITTGTTATTFSPDASLTRAHLVTFLYRYKQQPAVTINADSPTCEPGPEGSITTGTLHSCAIRVDNTATCWGSNYDGESDVPAGQYKMVAAGGGHSCGLRVDNTATCWGSNDDGRADAPAGQYKAISAGAYHSCAIRVDNTATCWGGGDTPDNRAVSPAGQFKTISAGLGHSCGIRLDNTATCWGANDNGQSDAPAGQYKTISAGSGFSCAIRLDNTATCWGGSNFEGQSDVPAGQYKAISAGFQHSCAIRLDNTATCWGYNSAGQSDAPAGQFR